jgi:hypothetical protein
MWHYAPPRLKPRLVFLADETAAVRYMGFDTIDGGVRHLLPWAEMNVVDYAGFVKQTREFLVYRNLVRPEWVTPRVMDDGASVEVRSVGLHRELIRVRLK